MPRSARSLANACSVAGHIDHVILWRVQFSLRAGFCRPFSSFFLGVFLLCEQFFTVVVDFTIFRCFSVCFFEGLVHMPRNTVNSISASLDPSSPSDESALSTTANSTSSSSSSLAISAETLSQAISQAFQQSLSQMLAALRENGAPNSTSSSSSGNSSAASFATSVPLTYTPTACRSSSSAGSVTVSSFLSTYSSVGIPVVSRASQPPVTALSAPSLFDHSLVPSTSSPTVAPSVGKAFVVGPGYAPIPGKLVAKITSDAFIELEDLLAENIRAQEAEPHSYLDGKLLVAPAKKRVVEINDILTWIQAFTIYQWIFSDLVEWVLKKQYDVSFLLHYLDDFHTLGPPNFQTCQRNLDTCIQQFHDWRIPLHPDKLEGPSTLLTVLGIELDSLLLQVRLPQEKFDRIHTLLVSWSPGHLNAIPPGRSWSL